MSRISATISASNVSTTSTQATVTATANFKYASGTWGWTVSGYLSIGSSKKTITNVRTSTTGGTFGTTSHSLTVARTKVAQSITIKMYGYCTDSTSDTASATKTVTVPALDSYVVTCDGTAYTKWYGEDLTLPSPTRGGYTFGGWSDGTTNFGTTYTVNASATLSAVWIANSIPPTVTSKAAVRGADKTVVTFSLRFTPGRNADDSVAPVTRLKLETSPKGADTWTTVQDVTNPTSPHTVTLGTYAETSAYDVRWILYDANYPGGVIVYELLTKVAYIFKATGDGIDFDVPLTVQGKTPLYEDSVVNTIVEQGAEGIYQWRKWSNGDSELWAYWRGSNTHYSTVSSFYSRYFDYTLPTGVFKDLPTSDDTVPNVQASGHIGSGFAVHSGVSYGSNKLRLYFLSTASGNQTCAIWLYAHGKWK